MADESLVQPATAPVAAAPVEPTPEAAAAMPPEAPAEASLPDEVLQIPAMQALMAGNPPALSASLTDFAKRPEAQAIMSNKEALMAAGMGTYRSLSGDLGVLFNRFYVSPEEITAADKNGQLASIAIPFDVVNQQVAGSGEQNPVLEKKEAPEGFRTAPAATPPQSQSVVTSPGPSSEAELNAQRARLKNSAVGGPTSGARPAAGRLLNSILKPVL